MYYMYNYPNIILFGASFVPGLAGVCSRVL